MTANQVLAKADAIARAESRRGCGGAGLSGRAAAAGEGLDPLQPGGALGGLHRARARRLPHGHQRGAAHRAHRRRRVGARLDGAALRLAGGPARDRARQAPALPGARAARSSCSCWASAPTSSTCPSAAARSLVILARAPLPGGHAGAGALHLGGGQEPARGHAGRRALVAAPVAAALRHALPHREHAAAAAAALAGHPGALPGARAAAASCSRATGSRELWPDLARACDLRGGRSWRSATVRFQRRIA